MDLAASGYRAVEYLVQRECEQQGCPHESIPDDHHNPYSKIKSNLKDSHFKRRNNRSNKNDDVQGRLRVYHQNIRGVKDKVNELSLSFLDEAPHIICLTKHHLKEHEIEVTHIP